MSFVLVAVGVLLLYFGGEWLVRYASVMGQRMGMSPLVVGLTVVAFGTSAPEMAASLTAALQGSTEMAFGNVVGSNIANLGLVLGITVLVQNIRAKAHFLRREIPFMVGISLVVFPLAWNGLVGRVEGAFLLVLMVPYLVVLLRGGEIPEVEEEFVRSAIPSRLTLGVFAGVVLGSVLLVAGAKAVVMGGSEIARAFGVSERVIGLTVLAIGTSLPELASSIAAAVKNEGDIVLGNLVGSNICNVLVILGTTAVVTPITVSRAALTVDVWLMVGMAALLIPLLWGGRRMRRREGAFLLVAYVIYCAALIAGPEGPHLP